MKSPTTPPRIARRFLTWFLRPELVEEVEGDLLESFETSYKEKGLWAARQHYWYQVFHYLRPFAIRPDLFSIQNPMFMTTTNLRLSWRRLFTHKLHTGINLAGMTIGITCCLLIAFYIQYEFSYDQQHTNAARIYRVVQEQSTNYFKGTNQFALSPCTMAPALKAQFPEVENATSFGVELSPLRNETQIKYVTGVFADSAFLDIFDYTTLAGSPHAVLYDPSAIVLTKSMAEFYFGHSQPLGETLTLLDKQQVIVKAVIEDVPPNQHFKFDFITSILNSPYYEGDITRYSWGSNNYRTYLLLAEGYSMQGITDKLPILDAIAKPYYSNASFYPKYFLQPLTDIHLYSQMNMELEPNSDIRYIYLAISIGILILLLAFINYLNLANARSSQRIKAIGVSKVLGAGRLQVIGQLLTESTLTIGISFLFAICLAIALLPSFNRLMDLSITFDFGKDFPLLLALLAIVLVTGLLATIYPAMLAATVKSVAALKGKRSQEQSRDRWIKSSLIVGQFAAAIILMICTMIIYQQLQYTQNKAVGFDREQVVFLPYQDQDILEKREVLKQELLQHPDITGLAFGSNMPLNSENQGIADEWEGNTNQSEQPIYRNWVDYDFLEVMGMQLIEGRNFSPDIQTDLTEAYLLNESAVEALGWESAIGKTFEEGKIVGVVEDFHFQPFQLTIEPLFFRLQNDYTSRYGNLIVKLKSGADPNTLSHIEKTVAQHLPNMPLGLQFLDESYAALYTREVRFGRLFNLFSILAIFIACLGLFGLITHNVIQRTKEIGVRKVLGATTAQLISLLSGRFLLQVVTAAILATPLAWWAMRQWLQTFAYRIDINIWVFIWASLAALILALVTTGFQAWRAALQNPAETLKME